MANVTSVEAIHIEREFVRVEFQHSGLVSDHPPLIGGSGKGPSPGDIMLSGLVSASVFSALDAAKRYGVDLKSVVARADFRSKRESVDGPLSALGFLSRFWRRLEIDGALNGVNPTLIAGNVGILETFRHGVDLQESVSFRKVGFRRPAVVWKNAEFAARESTAAKAPGTEMTVKSGIWRMSATPLDNDTVLVELPGAPICVSRYSAPRRGPTPIELVCGGLAACTAIYVGRNAPLHDIPLERVAVTVRAETPADLSQAIRKMEKLTTIVGDLTEAEMAKCKFFADFCALGETLKRGAELIDDVIAGNSGESVDARSPLANISRSSPPPSELACDDGACCIYTPPAETAVA